MCADGAIFAKTGYSGTAPKLKPCYLDEAVTEFASRTAQKLRKQGTTTSQVLVLVFARTSPFRKDPQYSRSSLNV